VVGGEWMKYIGFWKIVSGDVMDVIDKFKQMATEREKGNEKFAKLIFGPFQFSGEAKGFTMFETDDPETLTNIANFYTPEIKWKFFSINDPTKAAEFYKTLRK
jgi:peptide subunit release factor RF-3